MSLEQALEENTAALRELVAEMKKGGGKSTAKTSDKAARQDKAESAAADAEVEQAPKVSKEELESKIKEFARSAGKQEAKDLMKGFGYAAMAEIKAKDYDAVYDAVVAAENAEDEDDI